MPKRRVTITLQNFDKSLRAIADARKAGDLPSFGRDVLRAGEVAKASVLDLTPDGPTGNLRKAVKAERKPDFVTAARNRIAWVYMDAAVAPHALLVEFGHGGPHPAPAHPYFRPGVEQSREQVKQIIVDGLKKALG